MTSLIRSGSTRCTNVPWPVSFVTRLGSSASRCIPSLHGSTSASPADSSIPECTSTNCTSGSSATNCAASAIWFENTWSSKTQPYSASRATLRRSTGSFIRSGAEANRYCSLGCQCSCSRIPRISGDASACASNSAGASSRNRSAAPTIACGQPDSSWTCCTHVTSSSERSSGQFVCTYTERSTPAPVASAMNSSAR